MTQMHAGSIWSVSGDVRGRLGLMADARVCGQWGPWDADESPGTSATP